MKLGNLFRKPDNSDSTMEALENELDLMISMDLAAPPVDAVHGDGSVSGETIVIPDAGTKATTSDVSQPAHRLTSYTQARLASLSTIQDLQFDVAEDLKAVTAILARLGAATSQTREFISSSHASIHRSNQLELGHAALLSENRRLQQQVEQVKRLRSQHETLAEAYRRKEARHEEEVDELKVEAASVRAELQDARDLLSRVEAERAVLLGELSSKSAVADRNARENELLREKQSALGHDLARAERRAGDMERKVDEVTAVNVSQSGQIADLRSRLTASEKEIFRLQKQLDTASAHLDEAQDALSAAESRMEDSRKLHAAEAQRLMGEIETLKARVDISTKAEIQASDELGALKQKLVTLETDKMQVEERLQIAKAELKGERARDESMTTQAIEAGPNNDAAIMLEARNQEIDDLRLEIKSQKDEIRRLASVERLYNQMKQKGRSTHREAAE